VSMLHHRAGNIPFSTPNDLYEVIGYLCTPGRVQSIDAEVPISQVHIFRTQYPGQCYPISNTTTVHGNPIKYGVQFRINFLNVHNAPPCLVPYLKVGKGAVIVSRINRSRFVEDLVLNHGFVFGSTQNIALIRSRIPHTFVPNFIQGFQR
jgi:hypothetical protein